MIGEKIAMPGMLYLVPTPIGNLGDISRRCREILEEVDFIAAEDTRVTLKLLNHLELKKKLVSYHRHNAEASGKLVLERLLTGESCALVTDAGTPAVSDPGEELVALCVAHGVEVCAIPGPCALIVALSVSGLPTARFTFEGFLPMNRKNRKAQLNALKQEQRTMLFYEAPHKLNATLSDFCEIFGAERRIALCRELTKLHEEVRRTTVGEAVTWYRDNPPRGEFVLVVEGAAPEMQIADPDSALEQVMTLREQGFSLKAACKQVSEQCGISKNQLYEQALNLANLPSIEDEI